MKRWTPDPTLLGGMRATVHGTFIDHHDLKQALAEKDLEIAQLQHAYQLLAEAYEQKAKEIEALTAQRAMAKEQQS